MRSSCLPHGRDNCCVHPLHYIHKRDSWRWARRHTRKTKGERLFIPIRGGSTTILAAVSCLTNEITTRDLPQKRCDCCLSAILVATTLDLGHIWSRGKNSCISGARVLQRAYVCMRASGSGRLRHWRASNVLCLVLSGAARVRGDDDPYRVWSARRKDSCCAECHYDIGIQNAT